MEKNNIDVFLAEIVGTNGIFRGLKCIFYLQRHYIPEDIKKGNVAECTIIKYIRLSEKWKFYRYWLPEFFQYINANSISWRILRIAITSKKNTRSILLEQLGHMYLSKNQLEYLNKYMDTPEAFYKLIVYELERKPYNSKSFFDFLFQNQRFICTEMDNLNIQYIIEQINVSQQIKEEIACFIEKISKHNRGNDKV